MMIIESLLVILLVAPFVELQGTQSNETHFIATLEWQEIKPGQQVPSGLHYRMNLQTGYKEAKILVPDDEKTSLVQVDDGKDDETTEQAVNSDVDIEAVRKRMEDAIKNIPSDKFESNDEEWQEIAKKYKTYKEIKSDLKELKLEMKSEGEILKELVDKFLTIPNDSEESSVADMLTVLEDLEYMSHSIDNSLLFISMGGLEKIIIPNLNHTDEHVLVRTIKTLGVVLQNNNEAKNYATEKTNIGNYLISILSKSIKGNQLSAALFAYGSLMRNNRKVSAEVFKKGISVLNEIIAAEKSEISLSMKTKALVLVDDLLRGEGAKDHDLAKLIDSSRVCKQLETYFSLNRNGFISDIDSTDKAINALAGLKENCLQSWSESPIFRHTLLVLLNHSKSQLDSSDEDIRSIHSEIIPLLNELNKFLYKDLKISNDDLSQKYDKRIDDEL